MSDCKACMAQLDREDREVAKLKADILQIVADAKKRGVNLGNPFPTNKKLGEK